MPCFWLDKLADLLVNIIAGGSLPEPLIRTDKTTLQPGLQGSKRPSFVGQPIKRCALLEEFQQGMSLCDNNYPGGCAHNGARDVDASPALFCRGFCSGKSRQAALFTRAPQGWAWLRFEHFRPRAGA